MAVAGSCERGAFVGFRASTNDDYDDDDHDRTRIQRMKRINTDDVSNETSSTKLNREIKRGGFK